jgi:hypothetical protein
VVRATPYINDIFVVEDCHRVNIDFLNLLRTFYEPILSVCIVAQVRTLSLGFVFQHHAVRLKIRSLTIIIQIEYQGLDFRFEVM